MVCVKRREPRMDIGRKVGRPDSIVSLTWRLTGEQALGAEPTQRETNLSPEHLADADSRPNRYAPYT